MKKFFYVILGLFVAIVVVLLVAPLFISVDQFRPQLVTITESKLKAKVNVGKLKLRLFPNFKISSDSLSIVPAKETGFDKKPLIQSSSISLESSLLSLLSSPHLLIKIDEPLLNFVEKNQKNNIESILPSTPAADSSVSQKPAPTAQQSLSGLPTWIRSRVEAASFGLSVEQANVVYENLDARSLTQVSKIDFSLENVGLNQNMRAHLAAVLDLKMNGMVANGPMSVDLEMTSKTNDAHEILLDMKGSKDLSKLDLKMTDLFVKKAGIPFGASFAGKVVVGKTIHADFNTLGLQFGSMTINGSFKGSDLLNAEKASIEMSLRSNSLNLGDLKSYIPMVGSYKLSGSADFSSEIRGMLSNPALNVSLNATGIEGASPTLATPIKNLRAHVLVGGTLKLPTVNIKQIQMQIGKNSDLSMQGSIVGIESPNINLSVDSKNIDMDEIMGTPNNGKLASAAGGGTSKVQEAASTLPLDESLDQMAPTIDESLKNPLLDKMVAKFDTKLSKIKFMGAEYGDATFVVNVKNRNLVISKTSMRAYKGVVALAGTMKLVPKDTEFNFTTNLSSISMNDVVKAHAPSWVGALSGSTNGKFEISGKGFTKELLKKNLHGTIFGDVKDGKTNLAVIQVVNQVLEAIPKNLSSQLSSKARESSKNQMIAGDFETMKLDAQIIGRKVNLRTVDAIFKSSDERVGKFRFNAEGSVTFDQDVDMTGTAYLSPDLIKIPQLKGKSGQIEIPLKFGGKMYEPKVDVQYSVKKMGDTALKSVVQTEGKKLAEKILPALQNKSPEELKKSLKNLDFKKLFK